jgi:acyl carrier protein
MDTLGRIRQLAAKEFSINPEGLDPKAPLDTLGIDSLSFIEFMSRWRTSSASACPTRS